MGDNNIKRFSIDNLKTLLALLKDKLDGKADFADTLDGYGIEDTLPIYDLTDNGSTTGAWMATNSHIDAYKEGMIVRYKVVNSGGATETTLNINGLGAKKIYRSSSTALSTHYAVGSYLLLYYSTSPDASGCWVCQNDGDDNLPTEEVVFISARGEQAYNDKSILDIINL